MTYVYPRAYEGGSGSAPGSANNFAAVDSAATGDYIGASSSTGVIRTGAGLTYVDGGNFVTLAFNEATVTDAVNWSSAFSFQVPAQVGIGEAPDEDRALTLAGGTLEYGAFIGLSEDTTKSVLVAVNSSTGTESGCVIESRTDGDGDGYFRSNANSIEFWSFGCDTSNSYNFAINAAQSLSSVSPFQISTQGEVDLGNAASLTVPIVSSDPGTPANGMIVYNTTTNTFRAYENGVWRTL